jgi:DNA-binding CsgD family transcriptional regulator
MVERHLRHLRLGDDPVDPDGVDAVAGEQLIGRVQDALAGPAPRTRPVGPSISLPLDGHQVKCRPTGLYSQTRQTGMSSARMPISNRDSSQRPASPAEREVAVHKAVSTALAAWDSFEPGATLLLREMADALGLAAGALWLPRGNALVARLLWSEPTVDLQRLESVLGDLELPRGVDLAGQAWERRQPVAPSRSGSDDGFLERQATAMDGLSSPVALPAVSDGEVLAVLVLYSDEPLEPGERLMRAFTSVGSQLGTFLARRGGMLETQTLTARELDVLRLAAQGLARHQIEARLGLSRSTVKRHFEHIYTKLGVSSCVSAVAHALRQGLIE